MEYELHYLRDDGRTDFAQQGDCLNHVEALNRAWYFLGFSNAPAVTVYLFPDGKRHDEESGKLLATLKPLAKGSTAERAKGRDGSLADWIALFREDESNPTARTTYGDGNYSDEGITDADIPF